MFHIAEITFGKRNSYEPELLAEMMKIKLDI
jgi:hypothetical protein